METPLVSICSITYNHAPFIRQCLDGFLMQQCNFPIEIIINDDCSTDGTTEIIREYAEKYPDKIFPIFQEENLYSQGVRGMFQKFVFPKARGKYIALCEGDDYWTDPLKLQKQVDFLETHPDYSMCFHKAKVIAEDVFECKQLYEGIEEREYFPEEIVSMAQFIPTASLVSRAEVGMTIPFHPDFKVGDVLIHTNAFVHGRVYGLSEVMSVYRRHAHAWSFSAASISNYEETILPHNFAMLKLFPERVVAPLKVRTAWWSINFCRKELKNNPLFVLKILCLAIKYCPKELFRLIVSYCVRRLPYKSVTL